MDADELARLRGIAHREGERLARKRASFAEIAEQRRHLQEQMAVLAQADTELARGQLADMRREDNQLRVLERKFLPVFAEECAKHAEFQAKVHAIERALQSPAPIRGAVGERTSRVIPQDVKIAVAIRDQGNCVQCGSTEDLHYDHKIPWSRGGSNTVNNIQLLCGACNRRKGADDNPV